LADATLEVNKIQRITSLGESETSAFIVERAARKNQISYLHQNDFSNDCSFFMCVLFILPFENMKEAHRESK